MINSINKIHKKAPHMREIQKFNRYIIEELDKICSLKDKKILDLGASNYGYALVESINKGAVEYVGIDLDINIPIKVTHNNSSGTLLKMNAKKLNFPNNYFDILVTISTLEHFRELKNILNEMYRVIKKNGILFITFGPVWSSAYGFHLHQYPEVAKYIPPWSHLLFTKKQMRNYLNNIKYPGNLDMSLDQVISWIYKDTSINRYDINIINKHLTDSKFSITWKTDLIDDETKNKQIIAQYLSTLLPYTETELMIKGFTALLTKK